MIQVDCSSSGRLLELAGLSRMNPMLALSMNGLESEESRDRVLIRVVSRTSIESMVKPAFATSYSTFSAW